MNSSATTELIIDLNQCCSDVQKEISRILVPDNNPYLISDKIGNLFAIVDLLMESDIVNPHTVQNSKLKKRIHFNDHREFKSDTIHVLPNFQRHQ